MIEPIGVSGYELPDGTKSKAPVSVYGTTRGLEPMAVTDNKGQFELTNANPVFRMLLNVEARGFAKKFEAVPAGGQRRQIAVYRGAAVRGRLVDRGVPVSGAEIGLIARDRGGFGANLKVIGHPYGEIRVGTQPDGSFLLSDVPAPVDWFVYAKMTSLPDGRSSKRLLCATRQAGEIVEVGDLSLDAGHRFRGKIVQRDGSKMPDGMRLIISSNEVWDSEVVPLRSDGSFEFDRLATGTYEITPSVRGYKPVEAVRNLQVDGDVSDFQMILEPTRP